MLFAILWMVAPSGLCRATLPTTTIGRLAAANFLLNRCLPSIISCSTWPPSPKCCIYTNTEILLVTNEHIFIHHIHMWGPLWSQQERLPVHYGRSWISDTDYVMKVTAKMFYLFLILALKRGASKRGLVPINNNRSASYKTHHVYVNYEDLHSTGSVLVMHRCTKYYYELSWNIKICGT